MNLIPDSWSPFPPDSPTPCLQDLCHFDRMKGKTMATSQNHLFCKPSSTRNLPTANSRIVLFQQKNIVPPSGAVPPLKAVPQQRCQEPRNWWWNFLNSRVSSEKPSQTTKSSNDTHMWHFLFICDTTWHNMTWVFDEGWGGKWRLMTKSGWSIADTMRITYLLE